MLARDLLSDGHEVHLYCQELHTEPPHGLVVHRMPWIPLGPGIGRIAFSAWARRAVRRDTAQNGPYAITHGFGRTLGQDVYRMGGGCHPTYLDHAHALEHPFWMRRLLRGAPLQRIKSAIETRMLSGQPPPHVIANSEMSRDDIMHRYDLPPEVMHVVRNGIDLERFHPARDGERLAMRQSWGLREEDEVLLFLGNAYSRKGLGVLLRATAAAIKERPNLRLVVGGQDRRTRRWKHVAQQLGLGDHVIWLGPISAPEFCYRGADLYVLPTLYDPAANSTLEALASGLPVITSAMNGAAEILEPGIHGSMLLTPVRPSELKRSLIEWLGRARSKQVRIATRQLAERFPAYISCESTLDVYRTVLNERAKRSPPRTTTEVTAT